jgi:hypothetical protein
MTLRELSLMLLGSWFGGAIVGGSIWLALPREPTHFDIIQCPMDADSNFSSKNICICYPNPLD